MYFDLHLHYLTAAVLDWSDEQVEAARIGSALAGRPWRFIGPAQPLGNVNTGAPGDPNQVSNNTNPLLSLPDGAAYLIREENIMLNENRMYFDMHMHYLSVQQAQDGLNNLTNTGSGWGLDIPDGVVVLEFGPVGDENDTWWGGHVDQFPFYFTDASGGNPERVWDEFIKDDNDLVFGDGWEAAQYGTVGDFNMASLLSQIDNKGYAAVCYGPTIQGPDLKNKFAIAALRASRVALTQYINDPDLFSPIRINYETAAFPFQIPVILFKPHLYPCDPDVVCPPCSTN